ncbi:MAG: hypothetical protein QT10_C0005G0012 [archaeon GW2011_AR19]|nr:MAG: hypothetical protein QT10_C0005G0012 [archaeon GW2011_AR19]
MIKKINSYSRKYKMNISDGIYGKIVDGLPKISGEYGDEILVRGHSGDIVLIQRNFKTMKEIVKIHSKEPEKVQSHLENITGVKLSEYRVH